MKNLKSIKFILLTVAAMVVAVSCSEFRRLEKSEDWRLKYEAGLKYYEKKDYYHTAILFDQILPIVRGLPEGEKVEFYLSYCQYYQKTYLLASNQFKVFYESYGRSQMAEEAYFMYAYSLYIASPDVELDQKSSVEAMQAMQNFLNQFPGSQFTDKGNEVVAKCQEKLEIKEYLNAVQYLRLNYYQAAITSFDNFKKAFPDSKYLEEVAFLKVQAQYLYAQKSIPTKQTERYNSAIEFYQEFIEGYPQSAHLGEAQSMYSNSLNQINLLKVKNKNS